MAANFTGYSADFKQAGCSLRPNFCSSFCKSLNYGAKKRIGGGSPCFPRGWLEMGIGSPVVSVAYANGRVGGCSQIFTFSGSRPSFTHMVTNWSPSRHFPNPAIISTDARRLPNGHPEPTFRFGFVFQQLSFGISCVFISLFCRQETTRQPEQVSEDGGFRLVSVCRAHVYRRGTPLVLVLFSASLGPGAAGTGRFASLLRPRASSLVRVDPNTDAKTMCLR